VKDGLAQAVRQGKLFPMDLLHVDALNECLPRDRSRTRSSTLRKPENATTVEVRTALGQIVAETSAWSHRQPSSR